MTFSSLDSFLLCVEVTKKRDNFLFFVETPPIVIKGKITIFKVILVSLVMRRLKSLRQIFINKEIVTKKLHSKNSACHYYLKDLYNLGVGSHEKSKYNKFTE